MKGALDPEQVQRVIDLLPTATSLRQIARDLGVGPQRVTTVARPFVTLMRMTGELGSCACGKPRLHPYACGGVHNVLSRKNIRPVISPEIQARREMAIEMLVAGLPFKDIDMALAMSHGSARKYQRFMTPEQLTARAAIYQPRGKKTPPDEPEPARIVQMPRKVQAHRPDRLAA